MDNSNLLLNELSRTNYTYEFDKIAKLTEMLIRNGVSIREIDNYCSNLAIYQIIDNLLKYGTKGPDNCINQNAVKQYYASLFINQDRCILIADTHIGKLDNNEIPYTTTVWKNEQGLYSAYNTALKYGINNVIHLGDLIEGDSNKYQRKVDLNYHIEYLQRIYPRTNIKTYLLYGNHDYNSILRDSFPEDFYKVCSNMELIGVNYSYINFCGYLIKLSHPCKASEFYQNINLPHNFELAGHSHIYNVYEIARLVKLPILSSVGADKSNIGFVELINEENEFLFKFYDQYGNEKPEKESVLTKHIDNGYIRI